MNRRKCFVMDWKEIPLEEIKRGQVFRLEPASEKDRFTDKDQLSIAEEDAVALPPEEGFARVKAQNVAIVPVVKI